MTPMWLLLLPVEDVVVKYWDDRICGCDISMAIFCSSLRFGPFVLSAVDCQVCGYDTNMGISVQ